MSGSILIRQSALDDNELVVEAAHALHTRAQEQRLVTTLLMNGDVERAITNPDHSVTAVIDGEPQAVIVTLAEEVQAFLDQEGIGQVAVCYRP